MNAVTFARQFAGPVLAFVLFIGVAPVGLTAAEVTAIWGRAAPQAETVPRAGQLRDQTSDRQRAETAEPHAAATAARVDSQAHATK